MENLILKNIKLLFVEINDKDFGSSITVDVTEPELQNQITTFYANAGLNPKFKDYTNGKTGETTKQFSVKIASFATIQTESGEILSLDEVEGKTSQYNLAFGATVNIAIKPFEYDNKFGKGKSASVSAIRIVNGAELKNGMSELM